MGKKRTYIVAVVIALAVVAVCISLYFSVWVNEGALWRWVMTKVFVYEATADFPDWNTEKVRTYRRYNRWDHTHVHVRSYFLSTGYQSSDEKWRNGKVSGATIWSPDGKVKMQQRWENSEWLGRYDRGSSVLYGGPPWWWGVQDQTKPTDPQWIAEHGKQ